jgi:hypothetical protein
MEEGDGGVMLDGKHSRRSILYRHGILPQEQDLSPLSAKPPPRQRAQVCRYRNVEKIPRLDAAIA